MKGKLGFILEIMKKIARWWHKSEISKKKCKTHSFSTIIPPLGMSWVCQKKQYDQLKFILLVWATVFQPKLNKLRKISQKSVNCQWILIIFVGFFECHSILAGKQQTKQTHYSILSLSASLDTQDILLLSERNLGKRSQFAIAKRSFFSMAFLVHFAIRSSLHPAKQINRFSFMLSYFVSCRQVPRFRKT